MTLINPLEFALIGGGGTGEMTLIYLTQQIQQNKLNATDLTLHLIDPNGFGSGGIAYGQCAPDNFLNSTRNEMSPWNQSEFHCWGIEQGLGDNMYAFNRRSDNGRFLELKYQQTLNTLKKLSVTVIEHQTKADYRRTNHQDVYDIIDTNTDAVLTSLPAEQICLSDGYGPNTNFLALQSNPDNGYVHSPYDTQKLRALLAEKPNAKIVHIGANAALYDSANTLSFLKSKLNQSIAPSLTIISHFNKSMNVRDVSLEPSEQSLEPLFLTSSKPHDIFELQRKLRDEFETAPGRRGRSDRRIALDTMRYLGAYLKTINPDIPQALFKQTRIVANIVRTATPIPEFSAQNLDALKPQFIQGCLKSTSPNYVGERNDGGFTVRIDNKTIDADIIINATGHGRTNSTIMSHLLKDGLIEKDTLLNTVKQGSDGRITKSGFFYAGPATHFGIDGMESFAPTAEKIARHMSAFLKPIEIKTLPYEEQGLSRNFTPIPV